MTDAPTCQFDPDCRRCPRLAAYLDQVRADYPHYHGRPVAAFGCANARLLVVGLAPGLHGANATGRPFTGDYAGILLYQTLFDTGFANQPEAVSIDDGLQLRDCRITNAVKCVPPGNKPSLEEVRTCNHYLEAELAGRAPEVIVALGRIAHDAVLRAGRVKLAAFPFGHGAVHHLPSQLAMIDSYHCSRYNTQTGRLTPTMLRDVFKQARAYLQ